MLTALPSPFRPLWLPAVASLGALWNLYGVYQFVRSFAQTRETLMAAGMEPAQAELYLSLPFWLTAVFAISVIGGLFGTIMLLLRRPIAVPVLALSLGGYILLFGGDVIYGVFNAIPSQLFILAVVVAIAAAMLATAWHAKRKGLLA